MSVMVVTAAMAALAGQFQPTWESLDARPNPAWFGEAKFGIFIHWGLYSVPAWGPKDRYAEWYWHDMKDPNGETWKFHERTYGNDFKYQDFAASFRAELFNPDEWADLLARSGAKYVVLTSKHHEGYCLWPNAEAWNWNSVDTGPHRDLAGDLIAAVRARGLRMGFYYSLYEWFNPLYKSDVNRYVDQHMLPQMRDLVTRYKPDILWGDGEWDHPSGTWRTPEFLAWMFNESGAPADMVINDRWGKDTRNVHGGFATPEYGHIPEGPLMQQHRFEECQGMGKSFGYNRNENIDNYRSPTELIHLLIDNVSRGGNLLLDIGPTADGRIPVIMQQRLTAIGGWLEVNGEAIYGTSPWPEAPKVEGLRFTRKGNVLYAIALAWPGAEFVVTKPAGAVMSQAVLVGHEQPLNAADEETQWRIETPIVAPDSLPARHAYVFRLTLQ